jgi:hypothetical protein
VLLSCWLQQARHRPPTPTSGAGGYQDSYGKVHRARSAERSRGLPAAPFAKFLMILAVLVVLASLVH